MGYFTAFINDARLIIIAALVIALFICMGVMKYQHVKIDGLNSKIELSNLASEKYKSDADARIKAEQDSKDLAWSQLDLLKQKIAIQPKLNPNLTCDQVRRYLITKAKEHNNDK